MTSTPSSPDWPATPRRMPSARLPVVDPSTYDVAEEVARGGLGRVVKARDRRLGRTVAIKELLPGARNAEARFVREALITARLEHPSIVPVHEAGRWPNGQPFYAMKMVSGRSLAQVIDETHTFPERLALVPKVTAVAEAIAYAHAQGVIHRDIKPSNVIVGQFGETMVIDWGLAKELDDPKSIERMRIEEDSDAEKTVHGDVLGTPNYMPPEQARGLGVDERSDVYALGSVLYQVLAGVPPYAAREETAAPRRASQILREVIHQPPIPLDQRQPQVPADLLSIVEKAMSRDPRDRYRTASELAADLRRFETGQLISAHRYSRLALARRWIESNWKMVAVAAAAFLLLAGGGAWGVRGIIVARQVAEGERAAAERQRSLAQEARAQAEARKNELVLLAARSALERDPTAALAWLKQYPRAAADWELARTIAADAWERGVSRDVWRGHQGGVWKVAFSPDGKWVASASADRSAGLWHAATGQGRTLTGHDGEVNGVAFSPDGKLLASASDDGTVWLWALSPEPHRLRILKGHDGTVSDVAFFPDSRRLASIGYDRTVRVWDGESGSGTILGSHAARGWVIAVSPDGAMVASGGDDRTVRVWDVATRRGQVVLSRPRNVTGLAFTGPDRIVALSADGIAVSATLLPASQRVLSDSTANASSALAVAPNGRFLATAGSDHVVRLWDLETGGVASLAGHTGTVMALAFSPDGTTLASGSFDNTVRMWPLRRAEGVTLRGHEHKVADLAFFADGTIASAGSDGEVRLWQGPRGSEVACRSKGAIRRLVAVPERRQLLVASLDGGVELCDVDRRQLRLLGKGIGRRSALVVSPDGRYAAWTAEDSGVNLRELDAGSAVNVPVPSAEEGAFSADGRALAVAGRNQVFVCEVERCAATMRRRDQHESWVRSVAFSPDGLLLASAGSDRTVRLLELADGSIRSIAGHTAFVLSVQFSPDGRLLASGSEDTSVRLLEVATGNTRRLGTHELGVSRVSFSPDGTLLASLSTSEHSARLWEVESGRFRALRGHVDRINQIAFAPDGKTVATASDDGTIRLWNATARGPVPDAPEGLALWLEETTRARVDARDVIVSP